MKRISPLLILVAAALLASQARADNLRLLSLDPPSGAVDGVSRHGGSWPPRLDSSNSVRATFSYEITSGGRAEINLRTTPVYQLFRTSGRLSGERGTVSVRFSVVCDSSSRASNRIDRLTFSLDQLDSVGNWVRPLAVHERAVSLTFVCPEKER